MSLTLGVDPPGGRASLFCGSKVLHDIQLRRLFFDSKTFVCGVSPQTTPPAADKPLSLADMPMKADPHVVEERFSKLPRNHNGELSYDELFAFVRDNFAEAGSDMSLHPIPPQDDDGFEFMGHITDEGVRAWALYLRGAWNILNRRTSPEVESFPWRHSLLHLPRPQVVPGERFREAYYWDSYWVVRGLLVSGHVEAAHDVVYNLLSLAARYGFVPNGGRVYYLNRSQPPLLSRMVVDLWSATGCQDVALVSYALPLLCREHEYFTRGGHEVRVRAPGGTVHSLSRYWAYWDAPRPESYREDVELARGREAGARAGLYRDIASAAESGWDFSSRWMEDGKHMGALATTHVLPADLNAFLYRMETDIACLAEFLGDASLSQEFALQAACRKDAINSILWAPEHHQWRDLWMSPESAEAAAGGQPVDLWALLRRGGCGMYASNWVPLWCGLAEDNSLMATSAVGSLERSGLVLPGGIATSTEETGQQWDYPNAWPPLNHMLIEGVARYGGPGGREIARQIAHRWLRSNYAGYQKHGVMHEKYDARTLGGVGGGGEYDTVVGFGWTNGVCLALLAEFGEWVGEGGVLPPPRSGPAGEEWRPRAPPWSYLGSPVPSTPGPEGA